MIAVKTSTNASIIVQLLTLIISIRGIFLKLQEQDAILIDVLKLETYVQLIELVFYITFLKRIAESGNIKYMASTRYFDWVISTPIMLFTTCVYLKYLQFVQEAEEQNKKQEIIKLSDFWVENKNILMIIFFSNLAMLVLGYLGEIGLLDKKIAFITSTSFLVFTFYTIYSNYAKYSRFGTIFTAIMFVIWSVYGIAFLLDDVNKNNVYNTIDIFSKNFFGVYLYILVESLKIK
jgi:bacteriorhodopsin